MTLKLALPGRPSAPSSDTHTKSADYERSTREERERCRFIINSPAALGREATALVLATQTDLHPEAAVAILASIPIAATAPMSLPAPATVEAASWDDVVASLNAERMH